MLADAPAHSSTARRTSSAVTAPKNAAAVQSWANVAPPVSAANSNARAIAIYDKRGHQRNRTSWAPQPEPLAGRGRERKRRPGGAETGMEQGQQRRDRERHQCEQQRTPDQTQERQSGESGDHENPLRCPSQRPERPRRRLVERLEG